MQPTMHEPDGQRKQLLLTFLFCEKRSENILGSFTRGSVINLLERRQRELAALSLPLIPAGTAAHTPLPGSQTSWRKI